MTNRYQLITIGAPNSFRQEILDTFYRHTGELGLDPARVVVIDASNFSDYKATSPAFAIYFGDASGTFRDIDLVKRLQSDAKLILPVVDDLTKYVAQMPAELRPVNGFALDSGLKVEPLVGMALEGLGLLRQTRRLFISYKRDESRPVAVQLFEELEAAGFSVFLDTHSIRPAQPFQSELWHQLVDTDVVVLLNTPKFLKSEWTTEELARANSMAVGIVQLNWPGFEKRRDAQISIALQLNDTDFGNKLFETPDKYLTADTIAMVVSAVESWRARSLAARQFNLVKEFMEIVRKAGVPVTIEPAKYMVVTRTNGELLIFIPTIGLPQAFSYYQADQLVQDVRKGKVADVYLLYDHLNIRNEWLAHLAWLDKSFDIKLRLKTLKKSEAEAVFPTLI